MGMRVDAMDVFGVSASRQRRCSAKVRKSMASSPWETVMSKTVLITGATSGFGAAAARRFAAAGWKVIATGRRAERLQPLVDEFGAERVHAAVFDIRDPAAMEAALAALPAALIAENTR